MGKKSTLFFSVMLLLCIAAASSSPKAYSQGSLATEGHLWLEASPKTIETNTYTEFNIAIMAKNVSQDDNLIGVQFVVRYDPKALQLSIAKGSFLGQWAPHGTFASWSYFSDIGKAVYGELILPNATGFWDMTALPQGEGVVAILTFKPTFISQVGSIPLQFDITVQPLFGNMFLDKDGEWIPYKTPLGSVYVYTFNFESKPLPGDGEVLFEAPEFPTLTPTYTWNFGDGSEVTTNSSTIVHAYTQPRPYGVTLSTYIQELNTTLQMNRTVQVINAAQPINVKMDSGSLYFKGEKADFNVVVADNTQRVNASHITAVLYREGAVIADLTNNIVQLGTGLYEVTYNIPVDAQAGTYTLLVEAQTYAFSDTTLKSFEISPTLTNWDQPIAQITGIKDGIATVSNGITNLRLNLTAINATITEVKGNTVTISTALGEVKKTLSDTQSTATTTLYAASILSAIAVILALAILIYVRKK